MPTTNLALPLLDEAQAQKTVTHNEALRLLDVLVQGAVEDRVLAAPPAAPADGQAWIVGPAASGAWAGEEDRVAVWFGAWRFLTPRAGWRFWDKAAGALVVFDGTAWAAL